MRISPLRKGTEGSRAFAVSAVEGPLFTGHQIPPLSSSGSVSMALILPSSIAPSSKAPDWASGEAAKQFKVLCTMLRAKMEEPFEAERQFCLNGDSESLWVAQIHPRMSKSSHQRRG